MASLSFLTSTLFSALRWNILTVGDYTWKLLANNSQTGQSAQEAAGLYSLYSTYRNASAAQIFGALRTGALSTTTADTLWTAIQYSGGATAAQSSAYAMWTAYQTYKGASAGQLLDALKSGALSQTTATQLFNTLSDSGLLTQAQKDAGTMWTAYSTYGSATSQQLFDAIKAGKLSTASGSLAWTALYSNGAATQAQKDATAMWTAYQAYKDATAQQLFDALKSGALTENSVQWKALYVNGAATQTQLAADKLLQAATAPKTTTTVTSWTDTLSDATLKSLTKTAMADGQLSYSELFGILNTAKANGLSASEYQDLESLLKNGKSAMSSYLYDVTNKAMNGDSDWKTVSPLLAGASSTQVQAQLNKWFLGTDRPQIASGLTYTVDTAKLYGSTGKGSLDDINQGQLGDCYLLASMACMSVEEDASFFKSMIQDNGNNTYGVRFFLNGREDWVTVDNYLPTSKSGFYYDSAQTLWAGLVEKAYAELNETGALGRTAGNSYALLSGGSASPLTQMTGKAVSYHYSTNYSSASAWSVEKQSLVSALNNHQEVWVGSSKNITANGAQTFVSSHAFAVIGYDTGADAFILRNPWGNASKPATNSAPWVLSSTGKYWSQFEASMSDLFADGAVVATTLSQAVAAGASSAAAAVKSTANMAGSKDAAASLLNDPNKTWGQLATG